MPNTTQICSSLQARSASDTRYRQLFRTTLGFVLARATTRQVALTTSKLPVVCVSFFLLLVSLSVRPMAAQENQTAEADQPNILFIFADDHSYEAIAAAGHSQVQTPNIDRLANQGMRFTHAYNMGSWSGAVCVASRTMLNTGRFLWKANEVYDNSEQEREQGRFWSEYMRQAGYATYFTGKWHVKANATKAFDHALHVRGGMPNQTPEGYNRPLSDQPDPWSPSDPKFGGFWKGGKHWSEVVGDDAVSFLQESAQDASPFFMYIAFNAPHDPRQSPQSFVDRYPADSIEVPENFLPEYPYHESIGCGKNLRDEKLAPFPRTEHSVQVHRQEYYAIITHMDEQIGRILDELEATGQADNTWIFFTADHGLAVGRHGLFGKQNMYDHSVRVPFIVVSPEIEPGTSSSVPIYLQDVMPTSLELAGVEQPEHVDFKSLLPVIRHEAEVQYEAIYGAYLQLQRMVTWRGYKLILYPKAKVARLYHVAQDPLEQHDLAGADASRKMLSELYAKLRELQDETGDQLDLQEAFSTLANE